MSRYYGRLVQHKPGKGEVTRDFSPCDIIEYLEREDGSGIEVRLIPSDLLIILDKPKDIFYCMEEAKDKPGIKVTVNSRSFDRYKKRFDRDNEESTQDSNDSEDEGNNTVTRKYVRRNLK